MSGPAKKKRCSDAPCFPVAEEALNVDPATKRFKQFCLSIFDQWGKKNLLVGVKSTLAVRMSEM